MSKLEEITKRFIYEASIRKGFTPDDGKKAGGKVLTFGSCRLGVQAASKFLVYLDKKEKERIDLMY